MPEALRAMTDEAELCAFVADPSHAERYPVTPENQDYGIDNHSDPVSELPFSASVGEEASGV